MKINLRDRLRVFDVHMFDDNGFDTQKFIIIKEVLMCKILKRKSPIKIICRNKTIKPTKTMYFLDKYNNKYTVEDYIEVNGFIEFECNIEQCEE